MTVPEWPTMQSLRHTCLACTHGFSTEDQHEATEMQDGGGRPHRCSGSGAGEFESELELSPSEA